MTQIIIEWRGFIIFIQMKAPSFLETGIKIFNIFLFFFKFLFFCPMYRYSVRWNDSRVSHVEHGPLVFLKGHSLIYINRKRYINTLSIFMLISYSDFWSYLFTHIFSNNSSQSQAFFISLKNSNPTRSKEL